MDLIAFDIRRLLRNPDYAVGDLQDGLDSAPYYERFADAGKMLIRAIHAIPALWDPGELDLEEIEVYIGRARCDARTRHATME